MKKRILSMILTFVFLAALLPQLVPHAAADDKVTLNTNGTTFMNLGDTLYASNSIPYIVSFELLGPSGELVESASYETSGSYRVGSSRYSASNHRLFIARTTGEHTIRITTGHWSEKPNTATQTVNWTVDETRTSTYNIVIYDPCNGIHTWSEWSQTKAPTCTETGQKQHTCTRCRITEFETIPIEHSWGEWVQTVIPTCTETGERTRYCTICNATESEIMPALGHDWSEWTATLAPACTETGERTRVCTICNVAESEVIPATGHKWGAWREEKAATATTNGYEIRICKNDGSHIESRVIAATGEPSPVPSAKPTTKPTTTKLKFKDVKRDAYYYDAVAWAVNHNPVVTTGTDATHFSPNNPCTRAQMVTFLWRAAGEPKPASTKNPFKDVKKGAYYYNAVLWAVGEGITTGTSKNTFSPDATVTRAQTVTFLWRMEDEPAVKAKNPFKDVKAGQYYTNAVLWAVKNEITNGKTANTFAPGDPCTRAQIVTFLYRDMK